MDIPLDNFSIHSLCAKETKTITTNVTLPSNVSTGQYYLISAIGSGIDVYTSDNFDSEPIQINANPTALEFTSQIQSSTPSNFCTGSQIDIKARTENNGNQAANSTFYTKYYLPTDGFLGRAKFTSMSDGTGQTVTTTVGIPKYKSAGRYYLIARADANDQCQEGDEINNTDAYAIAVESVDLKDVNVKGADCPGAACPAFCAAALRAAIPPFPNHRPTATRPASLYAQK